MAGTTDLVVVPRQLGNLPEEDTPVDSLLVDIAAVPASYDALALDRKERSEAGPGHRTGTKPVLAPCCNPPFEHKDSPEVALGEDTLVASVEDHTDLSVECKFATAKTPRIAVGRTKNSPAPCAP